MNGSGAETHKYSNECRFLDQNRCRIAISLSKTALEARFGALEGNTRRLSAYAHIDYIENGRFRPRSNFLGFLVTIAKAVFQRPIFKF
jgi:hypothetical protein